MRILAGLLLFAAITVAQTETIKSLMDPTRQRTTGQDIKTLWSAGDQAAVDLRTLYDDDSLSQPRNLRNVLWILETAFQMPSWVVVEADREPRASISLLLSLRATVKDTRFHGAIDKLIEKLAVPQDANSADPTQLFPNADDSCIDPLAITMIPMSERKPAPRAAIGQIGDAPLRLSAYRGKPIVLSVWGDDSDPQAVAANDPLLKYLGMGLVVIGMWSGGRRGDLDAYLRRSGMENPGFPIAYGSDDAARSFGSGPLPLVVLIDRSGRIAAMQFSDGTGLAPASCTVEKSISALIAEPADSK